VIVLGFDTATPGTAVGLRLADGTVLEAYDDPPAGERPGHTTRLLPLADGLLAQAGLEWGALERIAVGVGPGTFTGLRIGVATARGLAQALGVELVGVSTLRALAEGALRASPGAEREVLAVIDARRGEVFVGGYATGVELFAPRALAPSALASVLASVESVAYGASSLPGPGWVAVGDGAVSYRTALEDLGIEVPEDASPLHRVSGACICELALGASPSEGVLPDYLRRPDAELALEAAEDSPPVVDTGAAAGFEAAAR
jgi:tRNA threonylcarbamoyladenosine biosynthesis protein TsaB